MQARMLEIHHKTVAKLSRLMKEAEQSGSYRVAKRIRAVILNAQGRTSGEISNLLHAPRCSVSEWLRNYDDYGFDGLLEGQRSGRPAGLTEKQQRELGDIIDSGPVAYGFVSGVWNGKMIAEVICDEFGVSYTPRHVRDLLDKFNFSVQRPKRLLAKADPCAQRKWRRYTYPNIKKKRELQGVR
jgi:transposase